ncbi:MAG: PqqD family protein [Pyrinomonadaceae bacterium]|nr:PqqD family protein [Pyrinomonadaceae bacterium]
MNKPKARNENIVVQEMESELLIYDLTINKAFCLNETSAMIWQLCDGKHSVSEISRTLSQKLNQPITEDLIWLALDRFKKDNLLEQSEQFVIDFNGLSRRQVIKKIGLASVIALPLVSSIVAPSAVMAQSGCGGGGCQPTGCLAGPLMDFFGSPQSCSTYPDSGKDGDCNSVYASRCCSGTAKYNPGSCTNTPPNQINFTCICG